MTGEPERPAQVSPLGLLHADGKAVVDVPTSLQAPSSPVSAEAVALGMTNSGPEDGRWMRLSSYLDSGAARSVCPRAFGANFGTAPSEASRRGDAFRTATGFRVPNEGDRTIVGLTDLGRAVSTRYAVADTSVALDSVSQICDNGSTVLFTQYGGVITSPSGERTVVRRSGDTYLRDIWIDREATGFRRPMP